MTAKKWIAVTVKVAVSAALIWWVVSAIDVDAAKAHIARANFAILGLSLLVLVVQLSLIHI